MNQVPTLPERKHRSTWVQTDRATHEAWMKMSIKSPAAGALLHFFAGRVGDHNAVVVSQRVLADLTGMSLSTIKRALSVLENGQWIEIRRLGPTGTVNAYVINDRVVWYRSRDELRHSLFSAEVIVSADEQPDKDELGNQEPLRNLPRLFEGERQLPSGPGLPPPSEPALPGMESDLPASRTEQGEPFHPDSEER